MPTPSRAIVFERVDIIVQEKKCNTEMALVPASSSFTRERAALFNLGILEGFTKWYYPTF